MLAKYEYADGWYNNRLSQNNNDETQTIRDLLNYGLYVRTLNEDNPQDRKLENVNIHNIIFILSRLNNVVNNSLNAVEGNTNANTNNRNYIISVRDNMEAKITNTNALVEQYLQTDGSVSKKSPLDINDHRIISSYEPQDPNDGVNKSYFLNELQNKFNGVSPDMTSYFKKDGSVTATGNFNLGSKKIINLADPTNDQDAINKQKMESNAEYRLNQDDYFDYLYVNNQNEVSLGHRISADINMDNHQLKNVAHPVNGQDAINKQWVIDHPVGLVRHPVSIQSQLADISNPQHGWLAWVSTKQTLYYFNKDAPWSLRPNDGTSGSWRPLNTLFYTYNPIVREITTNFANLNPDTSGSIFCGKAPDVWSPTGDIKYRVSYLGAIVKVKVLAQFNLKKASDADWKKATDLHWRLNWGKLISDALPELEIKTVSLLSSLHRMHSTYTDDNSTRDYSPLVSDQGVSLDFLVEASTWSLEWDSGGTITSGHKDDLCSISSQLIFKCVS